MSTAPDRTPPAPVAVGPASRLRLPGHWAVRIVAGFFAFVATFFLYTLKRTVIDRAPAAPTPLFWIAGDVIRAGGFALVAVLLWKYAAAVRRYNIAGDRAADSLSRAHAALWRWGAAVLVAHVAHAAIILITSPKIRLPPGVDPAEQRDQPRPN